MLMLIQRVWVGALSSACLTSALVVLGDHPWSIQGLARLGFSSSSTNSRFNDSLSGNMFIIPPIPQHPGQPGALLAAEAALFKCRIRNADEAKGSHLRALGEEVRQWSRLRLPI